MNRPKIICVHPIDGNLSFLKKLIRKLHSTFSGDAVYLRLSNNYSSHERTVTHIHNANSEDLVCLFCHGRSNGLLGCSFKASYPDDSRNRFVYNEKYGSFLDVSHVKIFAGKKLICLACDSSLWGKKLIEAGAAVFLGFTNVNFDTIPFLENNVQRRSVERIVKYKLREAMFYAITRSKTMSLNFYQFKRLLQICLIQSADNLILKYRGHKGQRFYHAAAECLLEIHSGIKLYGDGKIRL